MTKAARGWTIAALVATVALLATSLAWAVGGGVTRSTQRGAWPMFRAGAPGEGLADLPGTVVDVVAADMAMMGGSGMMGGRSADAGSWPSGWMSLTAHRADVPAGTVTLRVVNGGSVDHELVVLPLPDGQRVGQRDVGADGTVDESTSLGEASATNAEGEGEGIAPGAQGWVALDLKPGRYELVCNLPGHYAAGMETLLVVR
ncbi:sulfocyanin-like copper-binding protein [Isoptericola sp. b490]|uniref:sulfocyanin-like copper-binding protein n=1 Tax=Actinotalea lenta TaxID=3064654 RepID=UPI0027141CEB|nr:sulfocyanin-like copper-binding protein [Isoptericola sp. b490]MDO8120706.1 sulfocyanin-like copper-binding protein [Isoptericola sp. b490]